MSKLRRHDWRSHRQVSCNICDEVIESRQEISNHRKNDGNYENLECRICKKEEESQKHVYECDEIRKIRKYNGKIVEYEKIFGENLRLQKEIAKYFAENMKYVSTVD